MKGKDMDVIVRTETENKNGIQKERIYRLVVTGIRNQFNRFREWLRSIKEALDRASQPQTQEEAQKILERIGVKVDPKRDPREQLDEIWYPND